MSVLGKRIKYLREKNNFSQKRLAESLGITNVQLSRYETGDRNPDPDTIKKIADFFEVSTDYLFGRTNNPSSKSNEDDSNINVAFYDGLKDLDKLDPDERQFILDMVEDTVARFKKRKAELKAKKNK
ncbi:helix-turn-helix domain-containing protein [Aneurinibacillus aneurinilyticus]|nr:helix-turn-helix transcriptional regulator [Aneurinibacillus aneurinilyticus]MED0704886.1 helix-turn-helix transcriptional regulator [Aneurinibacillus aneurinilyticus]MED0724072.1 helix-turn-helix transcriptional regulator [Aneurinibacillus aneurinilyticus]MED0731931.1 helix-turn-helix transcriptional regulator [Aneurinibacillus aneurinilyticus]MED0741539.1 helix-turn-helix transcriptional regulator [Aneurinibacillus aneurinilyticus]